MERIVGVEAGKQRVEPPGPLVVLVERFAGYGEDTPRAVLEELQNIAVVRTERDAPEIVLVGVDAGTVDGGDPQPPVRIPHEVLNLVVAKAQRIVRAEILLVLVGVVLVEPAERTYPYMPLGILGDGFYLLVGNGARDQRTLYFAPAFVDRAGGAARGAQQGQRTEEKGSGELHRLRDSSFSKLKLRIIIQ